MPTYAYQCDACEHQFDEFQKMSDVPLTKCPKCKKNKLRRLISGGAALLFKGSGFYITDYRSESYKSAAKADTEAGKGGKTDTAGGESKAKSSPNSSNSPSKSSDD
jgi:putative FmdB family regulatory protein